MNLDLEKDILIREDENSTYIMTFAPEEWGQNGGTRCVKLECKKQDVWIVYHKYGSQKCVCIDSLYKLPGKEGCWCIGMKNP